MILHTMVAGFQFEYGKVSFQRFVARQKCFAGVHFCLKASASFNPNLTIASFFLLKASARSPNQRNTFYPA